MNIKLTFAALVLLALLSTLNSQLSTALAQGTAFTYQGRLNDGANPATGIYDLRFTIYDSTNSPGTIVAGPLTNSATAVSTGLFTVMLDFGVGVFSGADRWLEIGVRTNGNTGAYIGLSSRQLLTSIPYAVRAANFSGVVSDSQLSANIARLDAANQTFSGTVNFSGGSNNYSGTFTGSGAGLTNVPGTILPQMVAGVSVQAQPNSVYTATSAAPVTVLLATNANVGDVVRVDGLGAGGWQIQPGAGQFINQYSAGAVWTAQATNRGWISVASSADGSKLVAADLGGQIYTSTDGGTNWLPRDSLRYWHSVASSADGSKLVAVVGIDFIFGQIYTSTDSGTNWVPQAITTNWWSVASSADGSWLVAVVKGGQIYTSTDSGTNWTARETNRVWIAVASSSDGSRLVAVVANGQIYTSTDGGTNWTARENIRNWAAVASSSDGSRLVAVVANGQIYTSTDGGTNWTARESARDWTSVASSADGSQLVAMALSDQIYISVDGGANWTAHENTRSWSSVASSADGSRLVAVVYPGQIYTSSAIPLVGAQGSIVDLQFAGNGAWQRLNSSPDSATLALLNANQTFSGQNTFNNPANSFAGNGNALTGLNAANLVGAVPSASLTSVPAASLTGTLSDGQLSGNVALLGNNQIFFGVDTFDNPANSFTGDGSGLTSLNAGNITSGTVADARLSANVALRAGGNTFTNAQTFNGQIRLDSTDGFSQSSVGVFSIDLPFKAGQRFMVLTNGNVGIGIANPTNKLHVIGGATFTSGNAGANQSVIWTPGSASWTFTSDRNTKERVEPINSQSVLERLSRLPIVEWSYIGFDQRHIGPMAQDFHAQFPLNCDDKSLNDADLHGVALAAIQGLNEKVEIRSQRSDDRIQKLEAENAELKQRLEALEKIVLGQKAN